VHHAGAALPQVAQGASGEAAQQQDDRDRDQAVGDHRQGGAILGVRRLDLVEDVAEQSGLQLRDLKEIAQGHARAADAGGRHQQGDREEIRQPVAIPGPQAPGEVDADAGMQPDHERQAELARDAPPIVRRQRGQHPGIAAMDVEIVAGDARGDEMQRAERNDRGA
jgi:hypothetical protein